MFNSHIAYGKDGILVNNLFKNGFCSDEDSNVVCKEEKNQCLECSCSSDKEITSPNFPDKYPKNLDMTWLIKFPPGQRIKINFHEFQLNGWHGAAYLTISDGDFKNPCNTISHGHVDSEVRKEICSSDWFECNKHKICESEWFECHVQNRYIFYTLLMICHSFPNTPIIIHKLYSNIIQMLISKYILLSKWEKIKSAVF